MAGYSQTPLAAKLGLKPGSFAVVLSGPADIAKLLDPLPDGVTLATDFAPRQSYDIILCFTTSRAVLQRRFAAAAKRLQPAGGLWVAWPKKSSDVATDLNENVVRDIGLDAGLVDNKVCAIDETWSGLRFVIRLRDRPKGK
jgi:hypothetical protein